MSMCYGQYSRSANSLQRAVGYKVQSDGPAVYWQELPLEI